MSRLTLWNHHPRACVIPSSEYEATSESDRVEVAMAAILANVWIFNARTKIRKEWAFVGPLPKPSRTVGKLAFHIDGRNTQPAQVPPLGATGICYSCETVGYGRLVRFVDQNAGTELDPVFYCESCIAKKIVR